jgi:NAD-dependent dihydropyrimidine dehydrogenase PreA subunit
MAYVIAEPCIDRNDQSCVAVCPVDCISSVEGVDRKFYIDPDNCIDCGSCEQACPNGAIFAAEALPVEWAGFAWVDATWYADPAQARTAIDTSYPESLAS